VGGAAAPAPDPRIPRDQTVRRALTAAGLSEAVTFGIVEARAARAFVDGEGASLVSVANPLSAKFDTLRPSLLPGLVDSVAHNRRHGRRDVGLFEIGARFTASGGETVGVAFAWTGGARPEHWGRPVREVDFFDLKGVVEQLCAALDVMPRFEPLVRPYLVEGQSASLVVDRIAVGELGLLVPAVAESRGVPKADRVFVAEVNLDQLTALRPPRDERVLPLPRYPFVVRDLSIVVSDALPAEIIRGTIQAAGREAAEGARESAPLATIAFFDRYKGAGVPEGSVSLSVRMTFQAPDRTLTDAEVQQTFDRIVAALVHEHGAVQR
jgi:phenylalanyl-tRNA synthetase beta chain